MLVRELRRGHGPAGTTTTIVPDSSTTAAGSNLHDSVSPFDNRANGGNRPPPSAPLDDYDANILHGHDSSRASSEGGPGTAAIRPPPSAPPEDYDDSRRHQQQQNDRRHHAAPDISEEDRARPGQETPLYNPYRGGQEPRQRQQPRHQQQAPLDDDSLTLQDRIIFHFQRARMWYFSQSEDIRNLLLLLVGLIGLYVAFGGRFGLERLGNHQGRRRGNYHSGNAYDQYYEGQRRSSHGETQRGDYYDQSSSYQKYNHGNRYASNQREKDEYYSTGSSREYGREGSLSSLWSSFHLPNLFDGSFRSMTILGGIAYVCHRNGINPMQIIMFLNMMNGGGRRRGIGGHVFRYGGGGGFMGGGLGGFGGRPRRGW